VQLFSFYIVFGHQQLQGLDQSELHIHDELIARCRTGDRGAYYELYRLYSKAMLNVGYRITRSEEDAEDILQESFISAFRNLDKYRGDATFGAWLKRIVVNKAINALNKKKHETIPEDPEKWDVAEEEHTTEYREELTVERVRNGIEKLPDGYRAVLSLYLLEGYDHQEIGQIMGISESTSKSQLNRARARLKAILTSGSGT
jgi:RNA polymerase sigma factor (sigma-70 family)